MKKFLTTPSKEKRFLFFLVLDIFVFTMSFFLSFFFRFEFSIPDRYIPEFMYWIPVFILTKIFFFSLFKVYQFSWRYIGLGEFFKILEALFISASILFILDFTIQRFYNLYSIPLSVVIIDFLISLFFTLVLRASKRFYLEILIKSKDGKRTLIIGAGSTGERLVRDIKKNKNSRLIPVCFVDDDDAKLQTRIHGVPVCGKLEDIPELVKENRIETAIIAIPSLNHKKTKELFDILKKLNVSDIKIVPPIFEEYKGSITIKDLKDISIEDLLYREPVKIEKEKIKNFFRNKTILVSGAGGSIGSEIVRQLLDFQPKAIVALEIDETEVHNLSLEIKNKIEKNNMKFYPIVADVRDKEKLERIFSKFKPQIVFHAAAYKHVPLMEYFPEEAVKTNIFGTYNMAIASINNGVEKFINISTDKAVNPTSIMGATKRMAEMICSALNELGKTRFISVRFGNVLGSRGSVIPIFLEQIKKGGPVTVTHPEMKRYFMTISEAVLLVFQAAYMGKGSEVFVLDMGEPVKITKLAEELIKLQGLEPYKDIQIVFTGLRPGEKLFEELLTAEEGTEKTYHNKIFIAKISKNITVKEVENILSQIYKILNKSPEEIKEFLKRYVPFYKEL